MDIYTGNKLLYINLEIDEYLEPGSSVTFIKKDKTLFRILNSQTTFRQNLFVPEKDYLEGVSALKERLVPDRSISFQIYDAYGYEHLHPDRQDAVIRLMVQSDLPSDTNLLNLLNIKYVI